ncbi:hypothetical protein TcasGA2_TC011852 [Tribolium castaneum]|uniref:Uncharacterized protein n=1 Tax=Tribolium castaneum TaxID=7070 RepID=D6WZE2_TRICA|nr:hypothetical protein TcasGA2_TC011852 [Tribolium castaneum]
MRYFMERASSSFTFLIAFYKMAGLLFQCRGIIAIFEMFHWRFSGRLGGNSVLKCANADSKYNVVCTDVPTLSCNMLCKFMPHLLCICARKKTTCGFLSDDKLKQTMKLSQPRKRHFQEQMTSFINWKMTRNYFHSTPTIQHRNRPQYVSQRLKYPIKQRKQ